MRQVEAQADATAADEAVGEAVVAQALPTSVKAASVDRRQVETEHAEAARRHDGAACRYCGADSCRACAERLAAHHVSPPSA